MVCVCFRKTDTCMKPTHTLFNRLLMLACVMILATACRKTEEAPVPVNPELAKLPPETRTGANTGGMLLNGEAWVAQSSSLVRSVISQLRTDGLLDLTLYNMTAQTSHELNLVVRNVTGPGIYKLERIILPDEPDSTINYINPISFFDFKQSCFDWGGQQAQSGQIEITYLDRTRNVIAGRFSFVSKPTTCVHQLNATSGRFDVVYNPY